MRFKRTLSILLLLCWSALMLSPMAFAQDPPPEEDEGPTAAEVAAKACLDSFGTFLGSLLDFDNFKEYWDDVLVRNTCHQDDIFALDDEVEQLMKELREDYMDSCSSDEIDDLQQEIREKKMEIHFLRAVVPIGTEDSYTEEEIATLERGYTDMADQVYVDMVVKYSEKKNWITPDRLWELKDEWVTTYENRYSQYLSCESSPWEEVAVKMEELVETFKAIKESQQFQEDLQKMKDDYENERAKRNEEANLSAGGDKSATISSFGAFLSKHIDVAARGVQDLQKFDELLDGWKGAVQQGQQQSYDSTGISVEDSFSLLVGEEERYAEDLSRAELRAHYQQLYQAGTAEITNDLTFRIQETTLIIQNSADLSYFLPGLKKEAKNINKKQGKGSPG